MPCHLSSSCLLPMNIKENRIKVIIDKYAMSKLIEKFRDMGAIMDVTPNTHKMLNIFDPTILPTAISMSFFRAATIDVISSGKDVPIATIIADIIKSLIPKLPAINTAPFTTHLPPK